MKRWIYLSHRWLGVGLCLLMAPWFLSGMVMMYVGYPKLTDAERWAGLPVLLHDGCCVPLAQALRAAGVESTGVVPEATRDAATTPTSPRRRGAVAWRLTSVAGTPTYVFSEGQRIVAVDATTGLRISKIDADAALSAARHFAGGATMRYLQRVHEDAWTHSKALDPHRPLHVVEVDDEARRWLYISERSGEVVRDATRVERTWGWIGAWLHWLYMFRGGAIDGWWHQIIVGTSVLGTVLALTGLVVGIWRWRFTGRYKNGRHTPYAEFHARWHHVLGMLGGMLAFTWVLSGLLSVNPWRVFDAPGAKPDRAAYAGGPLLAGEAPEAAAVLRQLREQGLWTKELTWHRVGGEHHVQAHGGGAPWVVDSAGLRTHGIPPERWQVAAATLLPGARIVESTLLTQYDAYYFSREPHTMTGGRDQPLPVWRLRFNDSNATAVTIDPRTGAIVHVQDNHRRASRWLFGFLHSFDLPMLLNSRPLWDIGMIVFSLFGLGLSLTGIVTGWRRLRHKLRTGLRHG